MEAWTYSRTAYRIKDGELTAFELPEPPLAFAVPEPVASEGPTGEVLRPLPGHVDPEQTEHAVLLAHEVAVRVTPWATWYFAPQFNPECMESSFGGITWREAAVSIVRLNMSPGNILSLTLHEAWHLCEGMVAPEALADLDAQLATGPAWPGDYYPLPWERRARAFAAFGVAMTEGMRMTVSGPHVPHEVRLFWHVFDGSFAGEVMRTRNRPAPGRLRRALATIGI